MSQHSLPLNESSEYNQFNLYGDVIRQALRHYQGILMCFKRQDMDSAVWIMRDERVEHSQDGINESEHPELAYYQNQNQDNFQVGIDSHIVLHRVYGTGFSMLETTIEEMVRSQEVQLREMFHGLNRILFFHARDEHNPAHAYVGMEHFVKMMLDLGLWGQAQAGLPESFAHDHFHFKLINSYKSQEIRLDYCNHLGESKTFKQFHEEWSTIVLHMIHMMELQNEPDETVKHQHMLSDYQRLLNGVNADFLKQYR
jgi:hypothetical protein